ncbi:hypothetical protein ASPSYDRAFT_81743 [Aspergillus sydowii CBS 593.65]|uniref:Alpha/beta hydrolase fold-3 domain-containing protein n=1 Tax=Aspergillus sydowii CBS 593.65 TaxID=1036612 RepID=A0A1L9T5Z2_9EURO|nr:uncharacterized protein ASPSYDRAFT_81743 [Aspergillus sydowii CBS 593.65]OJJ54869.1 hypothetical protein ASPSYDRAFT_81743 [Aspergillus sydowii CBS 593.65]
MAPSREILESSRPDPAFEQAAISQSSSPFPTNASVQTLRSITEGLKREAREALGGPPPTLTEQDISIPVRNGRSVLSYVCAPSDDIDTSPLPILLFFHGGGFCIGSRHDDLDSNRAIAARGGIIIVSLEYSLAPERPFPCAIHDGFDALQWISNNPSRIHPHASPSAGLIIGGTSAGGTIANAVVYLNRDLGSPVKVTGQLLSASPLLPQPMVPARYRDDSVSHAHNAKVAIPAAEVAQLFLAAYKPDHNSPLCVPAIHPSGHAEIPPTYFQACGLDVLRDETIIYEQILRDEHRIPTRLDLYPGLPHHFWEFFPQLTTQIEKRTDDTVKGIHWLLNLNHGRS